MAMFTYKTPFAHLPLWDEDDYYRTHGLWRDQLVDLMRRAMANTTFLKPLEIPGRGTEAETDDGR